MTDKVVLCVDDEPHILNALQRLLRKEDFQVVTARDVEEGLAVLASRPVQLVISDQRMPGMTGVEFLQKVKELFPDAVRVILSGYADVGVIVDSINKGEIYRFLTKPWNDEELKSSIRQCLAAYDMAQQNRQLTERIRQQNEELHRLNDNLEEMVEARTRSLQLSQEVLEKLPVPVLGVSREGILVLANQTVREMFPWLREVSTGTDVRSVFPPEVADVISLWLGADAPGDPLPFEWHSKLVRVHVEPLGERGSLRGCILMLGVPEDE